MELGDQQILLGLVARPIGIRSACLNRFLQLIFKEKDQGLPFGCSSGDNYPGAWAYGKYNPVGMPIELHVYRTADDGPVVFECPVDRSPQLEL